jgi:hypothetical protein
MDPRTVQSFIYIDIPDTRNEGLIQEQRFDLSVSTINHREEQTRCKRFIQGLRTELAKYFLGILKQMDAPEFPRVTKAQIPAVLQMKDGVIISSSG